MTATVRLRQSRLIVALCMEGDSEYLLVQSGVDREQSFVLPLRDEPLCGGLSLHTRVGRLHALYWGLAYGAGPLDSTAQLRFEPDPVRRRAPVQGVIHPLADGRWWVADADGIFAQAVLSISGAGDTVIPLSDRW